tara:strand:- start:20634 stop:22607 length:1974 start_codon:yes stop_codon:yes gene_type:complete
MMANAMKNHNKLGMDRQIDRRDFLNGVSMGVVAAALGPSALAQGMSAAKQDQPGYYPPALDGLRGSHTGSFEASHTIRDGRMITEPVETGEDYDLVIVGGGISGLAAAWFYSQSAGPDAKILILENHDDFGGHAKRNEYTFDGRKILVNGGTLNIEQPTNYSTVAMGMLAEIGIDPFAYNDKTKDMVRYYRNNGLARSTWFDKDTFGGEGLATRPEGMEWPEFISKTPMSEIAKRDITRLYQEDVRADALLGLSDDDKKIKLAGINYNDYLTKYLGLDESVLPFFQSRTHFRFYMGPEQVPALYCWQQGGYPGFEHLKLSVTGKISPLHHIGGSHHGREFEHRESSIYFPDGNATITRMLVRKLIPGSIPGDTLKDLITAPSDYSCLDREANDCRIRLNSTVVNVQHMGDPKVAKSVEVTYMRNGAHKVTAKSVILACWHMVIPYFAREFSDEQKRAMKYGIKAPRVYTNVLLRNGHAFHKLGVSSIQSPGEYHTQSSLHMPLSYGNYKAPINPDEPVVVKMHRAPCMPGEDRRTQLLAGRTELFNTPFSTFEYNIRDQLNRMLAGGGFDAARDIAAITVNRWPHGNAYIYNTLSEPLHWCFYPTDDRPCAVASKKLGRISIANSDAGGNPFTDVAIDEAHRAVREVLADQYLVNKT